MSKVQRVSISRASTALALAVMLLLAVAATPWAQAQYEVLYRFHGKTKADGATPGAGVILDAAGNLYGTTEYGGDINCFPEVGCGVVFKLNPGTGEETVLYTFTGATDGAGPNAGLIRDAAGNLYGTTPEGGHLNCQALQDLPHPKGCGVVFKLDTTGKETVLHSFTGGGDGGVPEANVIRDAAGNLYGTTEGGGDCCGVVFKLNPDTGEETVLYAFTGGTDGGLPLAGVIQDAAGNLYGATVNRGDLNCFPPNGCGVVFRLDSTGKETALYAFTGGADGAFPFAGVIQDTAGNLYGTTENGGDLTCIVTLGCGVVFRLDTTGKETVLYTFTGGADGGLPAAGVIRDAAGNLYGTTQNGGDLTCGAPYGCGVVFKLDTTGKETVLHTFTGGVDGAFPGGLNQDAAGNLYGTTAGGGDPNCSSFVYSSGCGVVFKLTP
jgi:uncharacterized repeat protein (TIGR03803 family)